MKIGILGGGITGLSLGYFLAEKGYDFEIVEKDATCGGLCRSMQDSGFTFDLSGGHIIFSKDAEIVNLMLDLLGSNVIKNRRNTNILYNGRYVKYPFENGLADLTKEENYECLSEFIKTLSEKYEKPKNFREWIYQTFGSGIAEKYMVPYNEKIWNCPPEQMATFWVEGRVPKPPAEDIIKSSLGIETEGYTHQLFFHYPKHGGIQALTDAIEKRLADRITKNFEIRSITRKGDKWVVSNGAEEKAFDRLVSTIPVFDTIKSMENVPKNVADAAGRLRYNSLITVLIGLDVNELTDRHWVYIPDIKIKTHRTIFLKNYSRFTCPDGKSSVMAEITYNEGDSVSQMSDGEIIRHVVDGLNERGLLDKNKVCYTRVARCKYAYVVYDLDYENNIKVVHDFFSKLGIELCGRFSEFKYLNMDACMRSAKTLVEKISTNR